MLFLDGVYVTSTDALTFRRVNAPSRAELDALIERISQRVGRYLERAGLLVRDIVGNCSCVALPPASMQSTTAT